jgi:hypothetical protein
MFPFSVNPILSDFEKKELAIKLLGLDFCKGINKGKNVNKRIIGLMAIDFINQSLKERKWFKNKQFTINNWVKYPYPRVKGFKLPDKPLYKIKQIIGRI